jgi:hypothetical protein
MLVASTLVVGCGYTVTSQRDQPGPASVAVPLFDNHTFEPFVETRVTERVKSRLVSTSSWRLVNTPERAAVVIRGAVTGFGVTTVSFDANNRPLEQRVAITAAITTESKTEAPLHLTLIGTAEYTETSDSLQTRTAKNRAIEEAGDGLAEALVARLDAHRSKKDPTTAPEPAQTPAAP